MELKEALNNLFSLHTFGIKLGLDNISKFLEYLGNPQKKLKVFHIAGSNGKGSTASFIASILQEFDYKVGLYTSPHFINFNERIKINNSEIPDDFVADFISEQWDFIKLNGLTFFEVTTAMAFDFFYRQKVNYAVIETGLGGRLDATNVVNALAVVLTSISLEHTAILGDSLEKITAEKAAIIKKHNKVFIGRLPDEAVKVISEKCNETNSELFMIKDYLNEHKRIIELYTEEIELDDFTMPLKGDYQKYNAALGALAVVKTLELDDFRKISAGIKNVIKNTGLKGRYEFYNYNPDIIFDSAHNPESIKNFLSEFSMNSGKYKKKILLFGAMKDKAIKEIMILLKNHFDEFHVTKVNYERSAAVEDLILIADEISIKVFPELFPSNFVEDFASQPSSNCLVVLGSMYLLGEIKTELLKNKIA